MKTLVKNAPKVIKTANVDKYLIMLGTIAYTNQSISRTNSCSKTQKSRK